MGMNTTEITSIRRELDNIWTEQTWNWSAWTTFSIRSGSTRWSVFSDWRVILDTLCSVSLRTKFDVTFLFRTHSTGILKARFSLNFVIVIRWIETKILINRKETLSMKLRSSLIASSPPSLVRSKQEKIQFSTRFKRKDVHFVTIFTIR